MFSQKRLLPKQRLQTKKRNAIIPIMCFWITISTHKRALHFCKKCTIFTQKKPNISTKRAPCISLLNHHYQREQPALRRVVFALTNKALYFCQKSPLHSHKKSTIFPQKEPCISLLNHHYQREHPALRSVAFALTKKSPLFLPTKPYIHAKIVPCCHQKSPVHPSLIISISVSDQPCAALSSHLQNQPTISAERALFSRKKCSYVATKRIRYPRQKCPNFPARALYITS